MAKHRPYLVKDFLYSSFVLVSSCAFIYYMILYPEHAVYKEPIPNLEEIEKLTDRSLEERFEARKRLRKGYNAEDYTFSRFYEGLKRSFSKSSS